ncbi:hypothetical protein [Companilactobacillus nodensis]|uniref:Uncharacterized protein n=1 Tax=Companilactobacillus nodensis DSM 19682 = JCM 14932 = NBRC 107160 TaxID=1423775 RepID=A0A0R1KD94_9LACO|nr:hypothetical protein [Companilactobacillus nodensis]KRK79475.1 hypothetical protein FD03_GL000605 [Companilactobacillus nodensis DSM 19682 = JCM 14932 = NBRC 107160]
MSEQILKDLPMVQVEYKDNNTTATLTFLDAYAGEIREINLHQGAYDNDSHQYNPSDEQAAKVEKIAQDEFGVSFDKLDTKINAKHDVYVYDKFCSLYHIDQVAKFDKDDEGTIFDTKIENITDNGKMILIRYNYENELHQTKYNYSKYFEDLNKYIPNPNLKTKKLEKFEDTLGKPFSKADELIGQPIQVEIKMAFGKFPYGEIKKIKKAKK